MNFSKILGVILLLVTGTALFGQNATVMRMTGAKSAMVLLPDAEEETPLTEGQEVPVGALITVGDGTKLFLRTFTGAITTASAGSVLMIEEIKTNADGTETTRIDLRGGDIVSNLDPAKKGIHDYRVRTPKGVAAARGTTYSVSVAGTEVLVTVSGGVISFEIPGVLTPTLVSAGQGSVSGTTAQPLANVLNGASDQVKGLVSQAMQATAAAVATLINEPNSGVSATTLNQVIQAAASASTGSNDQGALVATVAAAATQANASVASQVVQAAVASTATSGNASAVATTIVASVARAASTAPNAQPIGNIVSSLTQTATTAATGAGGNVIINTNNVVEAVIQSTSNSTGNTGNDVIIEVPVDNIIVSPSS